jgi:hypothetical protein
MRQPIHKPTRGRRGHPGLNDRNLGRIPKVTKPDHLDS